LCTDPTYGKVHGSSAMSKNITEYTGMLGIPGILRITLKWFLIRTDDYYYQDFDEKKSIYVKYFMLYIWHSY